MRESIDWQVGLSQELDGEIHAAMTRLKSRLRRAGDPHPVDIDLLEDDLREGRAALAEIEDLFTRLVGALGRSDARIGELVDLADDPRPGERVDQLATIVASLQRRVLQLAARRAS
jgi:hypothetical protein